MSRFTPILGPYQSVVIDGTARYSTALAPGKYIVETETSAAHVNLQTVNNVVATTAQNRIAIGGTRDVQVPPDGQTYYLAVIRSGALTGVLHISKVG